jgi:hypothetical protein
MAVTGHGTLKPFKDNIQDVKGSMTDRCSDIQIRIGCSHVCSLPEAYDVHYSTGNYGVKKENAKLRHIIL